MKSLNQLVGRKQSTTDVFQTFDDGSYVSGEIDLQIPPARLPGENLEPNKSVEESAAEEMKTPSKKKNGFLKTVSKFTKKGRDHVRTLSPVKRRGSLSSRSSTQSQQSNGAASVRSASELSQDSGSSSRKERSYRDVDEADSAAGFSDSDQSLITALAAPSLMDIDFDPSTSSYGEYGVDDLIEGLDSPRKRNHLAQFVPGESKLPGPPSNKASPPARTLLRAPSIEVSDISNHGDSVSSLTSGGPISNSGSGPRNEANNHVDGVTGETNKHMQVQKQRRRKEKSAKKSFATKQNKSENTKIAKSEEVKHGRRTRTKVPERSVRVNGTDTRSTKATGKCLTKQEQRIGRDPTPASPLAKLFLKELDSTKGRDRSTSSKRSKKSKVSRARTRVSPSPRSKGKHRGRSRPKERHRGSSCQELSNAESSDSDNHRGTMDAYLGKVRDLQKPSGDERSLGSRISTASSKSSSSQSKVPLRALRYGEQVNRIQSSSSVCQPSLSSLEKLGSIQDNKRTTASASVGPEMTAPPRSRSDYGLRGRNGKQMPISRRKISASLSPVKGPSSKKPISPKISNSNLDRVIKLLDDMSPHPNPGNKRRISLGQSRRRSRSVEGVSPPTVSLDEAVGDKDGSRTQKIKANCSVGNIRSELDKGDDKGKRHRRPKSVKPRKDSRSFRADGSKVDGPARSHYRDQLGIEAPPRRIKGSRSMNYSTNRVSKTQSKAPRRTKSDQIQISSRRRVEDTSRQRSGQDRKGSLGSVASRDSKADQSGRSGSTSRHRRESLGSVASRGSKADQSGRSGSTSRHRRESLGSVASRGSKADQSGRSGSTSRHRRESLGSVASRGSKADQSGRSGSTSRRGSLGSRANISERPASNTRRGSVGFAAQLRIPGKSRNVNENDSIVQYEDVASVFDF